MSVSKEHFHEFYDLVRASGVTEFEKIKWTLQNGQKEIMNSFGFDLNN